MGGAYYWLLLMYYNQWNYLWIILDQWKIFWRYELQKLEQTPNLDERLSDNRLKAAPSLA